MIMHILYYVKTIMLTLQHTIYKYIHILYVNDCPSIYVDTPSILWTFGKAPPVGQREKKRQTKAEGTLLAARLKGQIHGSQRAVEELALDDVAVVTQRVIAIVPEEPMAMGLIIYDMPVVCSYLIIIMCL